MRVLICGSRDWRDERAIYEWVRLHVPPNSTVIHGAARGADTMAGNAAAAWGHEVVVFRADWITYGLSAGFKRNQQMLDEGKPNLVVYFTDDLDASHGTRHMVFISRRANIPVRDGRLELLPEEPQTV